MTAPEDPSTSRLEQVMVVYDSQEDQEENLYSGLSRRALVVAALVSVSHAAALLTGRYAVAIALLVVALAGVGFVLTDRVPSLPLDDPE